MSAQRHVRRLRLSCIREEHAVHGRVLLEDAMRTATLGDEGQLIVVRRLDLGRLSIRASATEWSRRLEQRYRELQAEPVSASGPDAARAGAVYFASRQEPWLVLAQRVIAGQPCREWYWRPALPGWIPGMSTAETLRLSFRKLAEQGGLMLTIALALRLSSRQALLPLLQSLQPADLEPLKSALGFSERAPGATDPRRLPVSVAPIAWEKTDVRTFWFAAVYLARERFRGNEAAISIRVSSDDIRTLLDRWMRIALPPPDKSSKPKKEPAAPEDEGKPRSEARIEYPTPSEAPVRMPTRAGGLFFVVPLLARAGFAEFLATLPEAERLVFPWQVMNLVLRHGRIAEDDALWAGLGAPPPGQQLLGRWLMAANRHALQLAAVNLRRLLVRPALVTLSPTHIDFFFRPTDADVRIRRAGLDLDPGWVPWLGRIVSYHFTREG